MSQKVYDIRQTPTPCKWSLNSSEPSPHRHIPHQERPKICGSILEAIGNTPMVRINNITKKDGIECEILVKCEYLNPGGSVKDRIGLRMIEDAERDGRIEPGWTLIEPTSGNTGIGLALTAAAKGYHCIITLPEKMSQEKSNTLKALGAEIIRTPTEAAFNSPESHIGVADRLERELPKAIVLNQYSNASNPLTHYDQTAEEILSQCDGHLDYFVVAAGTGGTMTGISRKLKERCPNVKIIGVDPEGSLLADPEHDPVGTYKVEGIGYDFVPRVCNSELVDQWVKTNDQNSFDIARRLIKEEGILVGGSSGSSFWAALQIAKTLPAGKRVVVLLADSIRNYMTKFINDNWMIQNGFMLPPEDNALSGKSLRDLNLSPSQNVLPSTPCSEVLQLMQEKSYDQLPVVEGSSILGVVTVGGITAKLSSGKLKSTDPCSMFLYKGNRIVTLDTPLTYLNTLFEDEHFALVNTGTYISIVTPIDLARYVATLQA
ncbi:unnamed protein product [Blepharisma stoltei]|uniref:Cystathionine beta-synthase n=1 Tax=Blepharisma stoltei TaxID=1481888 RepID=A0AAU9IDS6_9CILI|nr:unnamed protein product [Blepharisma stoltei]